MSSPLLRSSQSSLRGLDRFFFPLEIGSTSPIFSPLYFTSVKATVSFNVFYYFSKFSNFKVILSFWAAIIDSILTRFSKALSKVELKNSPNLNETGGNVLLAKKDSVVELQKTFFLLITNHQF